MTALANTMGFVTPFKTFEDGYQSQNPLVHANDEYTKAGKTPVIMELYHNAF